MWPTEQREVGGEGGMGEGKVESKEANRFPGDELVVETKRNPMPGSGGGMEDEVGVKI